MGKQLQQITVNLGEAIAAGTDEVWEVPFGLPGTWLYTGAYLQSSGAVTANDTNYVTYSVELAGTEVSTEATTTTDLGSIGAGDIDTLAVSGAGADLEIAAGAKMTITKTDSGTGQALGASSCVALLFERARV